MWNEKVIFLAYIAQFKMDYNISTGRITILNKKSYIKLNFTPSNGDRNCAVIRHYIAAKFLIAPKGFVKVRTVLKTRTTLVNRECLQTTHRRTLYLLFWRKTGVGLGTINQTYRAGNYARNFVSIDHSFRKLVY